MGVMDVFEREDRAQVKMTTLYTMMKEAARSELVMNAVNCNVPHRYIREMANGEKEEEPVMVIPLGTLKSHIHDAQARIIEQDEEEKSE